MPDDRPLFAERFRVKSTRMYGWNYAGNGSYFITICTHERRPWFGEIRNGVMGLSDIGSIVEQYWSAISDHFPHVYVDTHVVMPDHLHGILTIRKHHDGNDHTDAGVGVIVVETSESDVSTGYNRCIGKSAIRRHRPGSLPSIMNQFKSACTKRIHAMGYTDFAWQPRFHDRVIRDINAYNDMRNYIIQNSSKWQNNNIVAQ